MIQLLRKYRPSLLGQHEIKVVQTKTVFALSWLIPGTNFSENRERSQHIVAQETINLNVTGERRIQVRT